MAWSAKDEGDMVGEGVRWRWPRQGPLEETQERMFTQTTSGTSTVADSLWGGIVAMQKLSCKRSTNSLLRPARVS